MINSKKQLDELGDLNPPFQRMDIVEFPPILEKHLKEMLIVGSKSMDHYVDDVIKEDESVMNGDVGGNKPLSEGEDLKYLSLLYPYLMELYFKFEEMVVLDREHYEKVVNWWMRK